MSIDLARHLYNDVSNSMLLCDVRRLQAHKLADRIHDIDLAVLDGKTVSEVRKWLIYFLIVCYAYGRIRECFSHRSRQNQSMSIHPDS